jgi:hypothetical protein
VAISIFPEPSLLILIPSALAIYPAARAGPRVATDASPIFATRAYNDTAGSGSRGGSARA